MNAYTVILTAQVGRKVTTHDVRAEDARAAVVMAYRERHGDHVTVTTRDVHARGNDVTDTEFTIYGTAGAITWADIEPTPTVRSRNVWRCAGGSGSGLAFKGQHGFTEVFRDDVDAQRAAGVELFRITV